MMGKLISVFILLNFFSAAKAFDASGCLRKIDKIYSSVGKKADFIIGPNYITIAGEGPTKIYSASGLVTVDGLGCKMDRNKKVPAGVGDVFYGLIIHMQKGLTKTTPRKAIFENEEMAQKINEAAIVCRQFSSDLMDSALNMLNIDEGQQSKDSGKAAL